MLGVEFVIGCGGRSVGADWFANGGVGVLFVGSMS